MKCEENLTNYKAMVLKNYEKMVDSGEAYAEVSTKGLADRYNSTAL